MFISKVWFSSLSLLHIGYSSFVSMTNDKQPEQLQGQLPVAYVGATTVNSYSKHISCILIIKDP